jgi:hypothetical protein
MKLKRDYTENAMPSATSLVAAEYRRSTAARIELHGWIIQSVVT